MVEKIQFTIEEHPAEFRELVDALENILFDATLHYLNPEYGCPTRQMANDVTQVRYLLDGMRKALDKG